MTIVEILTLLDNLGTLGLLKRDNMPASPDVVGCLYDYGSRIPERRFGVIGIGYEHPMFQLAFRGAPFDFDTPRTKSFIAWNYLAGIQPSIISGIEYLSIDPQQTPFRMDATDGSNRPQYKFNFYVSKVPS